MLPLFKVDASKFTSVRFVLTDMDETLQGPGGDGFAEAADDAIAAREARCELPLRVLGVHDSTTSQANVKRPVRSRHDALQ
jgi:hypothetical protein